MDLVTLILWGILGLREEWQPDVCDRYQMSQGVCERQRDEGRAWAEELARYVAEEATRFDLADDWDWIVGDLKREYNFERGNVCPIRIPVANVVSRELLDEEDARWKICWHYRVHRELPVGTNCQPVLLLSEDAEYLRVDRCAYGETGLFQVRLHEIPAHAETDVNGDGEVNRGDGGYVLPWGSVIPTTPAGRLEAAHDPRTNVHLGMRALAASRDTCCCATVTGEDGTETRACHAECHADPQQWLSVYNTGQCDGATGERYVQRVDRERKKALEYVCQQFPDYERCPDSDAEAEAAD